MGASVLLSVALLAAPATDAADLLKIAWDSQYEWRDDAVKNATLDFTFTVTPPRLRAERKKPYKGRGQIVVAGGEVVRIYYGALSEARRQKLRQHLDWVLARFVRTPFDEAFKGKKIAGPTDVAGGALKVTVDEVAYLIRDQRLIGEVRTLGKPGDGKQVVQPRIDYRHAEVGDGYAIVAERSSYERDAAKTSWSRALKLVANGDGIPLPISYTYTLNAPGGWKTDVAIAFEPARLNLDEPVVLDRKARDLLQAAWKRRFTLPPDVRIEGRWQREADPALKKIGFIDRVEGTFQVWGLKDITVVLDEKQPRNMRGEPLLLDRCTADIKAIFHSLAPRPFKKEFAGCGFGARPEAKWTTVLVYGYKLALAFRIEDGRITGRLSNEFRRAPPRTAAGQTDDAWWLYRLKKTKDDRDRIKRRTLRIKRKNFVERVTYKRRKSIMVPVKFGVFTKSRFGVITKSGVITPVGVNEYSFTRLRVSLPN